MNSIHQAKLKTTHFTSYRANRTDTFLPECILLVIIFSPEPFLCSKRTIFLDVAYNILQRLWAFWSDVETNGSFQRGT